MLGAITSINSIVITAAAAGAQTAASLGASDNSVNALAFDGLIAQAARSGSGAYVAIQPTGTAGAGTPLTGDGSGGIVEIDAALKSLWDNYRLSPDTIWVSSQEALNISKKILTGSAVAAQRFVFETSQNAIGGGVMVRTYLNRFSMQGGSSLDIKLHPNLPAGTVPADDTGAALSAFGRRQCHADPHAAGLLPDRMAAALAQIRIRRLCG